jgi:hypothetical protein
VKLKKLSYSIIAGLLLSTTASADNYNLLMEEKQIVGTTITDLNVNNKDLSIGIKYDLSEVNKTFKKNMSYVGIRYLNIDDEDTGKSGLVEANFIVKDFVNTIPGLKIGVGIKLVHTSYEVAGSDNTFLAVPFGIEAEYFLPTILTGGMPISLTGAGYYSPSPLSLMDANVYSELTGKINMRVLEHADIYVGYRNITTEYDNLGINSDNKINYNESMFVGVSFGF